MGTHARREIRPLASPDLSGAEPVLVWALILAVVVTGFAAGLGKTAVLAGFVAAAVMFVGLWIFPGLAVAAVLVSGVSLPIFSETSILSVGPVSLYPADISLIMLAATAHFAVPTLDARSIRAACIGLLSVAPIILVAVVSVAVTSLRHETWTAVGAAARPYMWYAAVPLMTVALGRARTLNATVVAAHAIAAVSAVLVMVGDANAQTARSLSQAIGGQMATIPNFAGDIARLTIPGMLLVPLALGLLLGEIAYSKDVQRVGYKVALMVLYAAGLLSTFGRGMWLWTIVAAVIVTALRFEAGAVGRMAAAVAVFLVLLVTVSVMLGTTQQTPGGLMGLVQFRLSSMTMDDPNVYVRLLEDRQVLRQIEGRELLGVGLGTPLGVYMGADARGIDTYSVHNGYFAVLGRFGVVGLAGLLLFIGTIFAVGTKVVRDASGRRLALAFGAMVGFVRGVLSAWTQMDTTSASGIITMALCASLLLALSYCSDVQVEAPAPVEDWSRP